MPENYDVGIIGAGIHGASAAFHLTSRQLKTVVFDARGVASGPTGRSSAVCRAYYTNAFLASCARDSIEMMKDFSELTAGRDASFRQTGFLWIHPSEDRSHVERSIAMLSALGIEVEVLENQALPAQFPQVDPNAIGFAVWESGAGEADPVGTTRGLLERAIELGTKAQLARTVTDVSTLPGGGAEVVTQDGSRFACERLLIAAGPWTRMLARQVGVDLPLTVERHFIATFGWGGAPRLSFGIGDMILGYYMRPEGRNLFLVGELNPGQQVNPDSYEENISLDEIATLGGAAFGRIPTLEAAESRGGWASLYDVSPDWQPVIGEIAPGVFVNAGSSGHGFKLAPALGRHVAELLLGRVVDPALGQFHPSRFTDHHELAAGYGARRIIG